MPTHSLEIIESAAARAAIHAGEVERRISPHRPVDVLVQHLCTVALGGGFVPDDLYAEVRATVAYAGLSRESAAMLLGGRYEFVEPDTVAELADGAVLDLAGLQVTVDHTPGHTQGSVTFRTPYQHEEVSQVMFSGDLLFAGSIGRTDLPGGDHPTMLTTLRDKVLALPDDIAVLPGHGEQTTIGHERSTNPFLLDLRDGSPAEGAARRVTRGL